MKFAYYPGCSAKSTCAELNVAMRKVAVALDLQLTELELATCTGAREIRAIDPVGFLALNVRILALAERDELPLMTICNTCTLNLIDANATFAEDDDLLARSTCVLPMKALNTGARLASPIFCGCCLRISAPSVFVSKSSIP